MATSSSPGRSLAPVGKVLEVLRARIAELEDLAIVACLPYAHDELVDLHEFLDRLYTLSLDHSRKRLHWNGVTAKADGSRPSTLGIG